MVNICTLDFLAFVHNLRMKYIDSNKLSDTQFKRYTGISWSTFYLMVEQLQKHVSAKGRPPKLSLEDQVLLCLSYWREYRTLFHVATSYGVSEPTIECDTDVHLKESETVESSINLGMWISFQVCFEFKSGF